LNLGKAIGAAVQFRYRTGAGTRLGHYVIRKNSAGAAMGDVYEAVDEKSPTLGRDQDTAG